MIQVTLMMSKKKSKKKYLLSVIWSEARHAKRNIALKAHCSWRKLRSEKALCRKWLTIVRRNTNWVHLGESMRKSIHALVHVVRGWKDS